MRKVEQLNFQNLVKGGGSGNFEFASSNEMWRATIEILDFVPLSSADYGDGIVITDWYNDAGNEKEAIKIMVQFYQMKLLMELKLLFTINIVKQ